MKKFACVAAVLFLGLASFASAGEIKKSTLSSMGLGSMQTLSDSEGSTVRGQGVAIVFGVSRSNVLGQSGTNGYAAVSTATPNALAAGASISVSGVGASIGPFSGFVVGGSVGGSVAFAR